MSCGNAWRGVWAGIGLLAMSACREEPSRVDLAAMLRSPTAVARAARLQNALAQPALTSDSTTGGGSPIAEWMLPHALQEISGLALTNDGRLLVHDDEVGQVWEVDYRRGLLLKRFALGRHAVRDDFEGIAVAHGLVFLLASNGKLYEFREGADGARVEYRVSDTGLRKACELEGATFDSTLDALLFACKHAFDEKDSDALVIYRWSFQSTGAARLTRLRVPLAGAELAGKRWKSLHPTDITIDPMTGNYVLVTQEKVLISVTPAGAIVLARPLPESSHQPEGLAITEDGILIVSDEAGRGQALMTLSRWP